MNERQMNRKSIGRYLRAAQVSPEVLAKRLGVSATRVRQQLREQLLKQARCRGRSSLAERALDDIPLIRAITATSRECPRRLLEWLVLDGASLVRAAAASNEFCPPDLLRRLAADSDFSVRAAAARNARCPLSSIVRLAHDPEEEVREAAQVNPCLPPQVERRNAILLLRAPP